MNCDEWKKRLRRLVQSGDAAGSKADLEFIRHAEECSVCAVRWSAARQLLADGAGGREELDEAGVERMASSVLELTSREAAHRPGLRPAVSMRLAFAGAAAAALVLAAALFLPVLSGAGRDEQTITFRIEAPEAREISIVGDWNGWDPQANRLKGPDPAGVWEISIPLRRGATYRYQFLVNRDTWLPDPVSPARLDDGFGGTNSLLTL